MLNDRDDLFLEMVHSPGWAIFKEEVEAYLKPLYNDLFSRSSDIGDLLRKEVASQVIESHTRFIRYIEELRDRLDRVSRAGGLDSDE